MSEYNLSLTADGASLSASLGNVTNISATVALAGPQGPTGATGATGSAGANGAGVPTGGATGQYLRKSSGTDHDTGWDTITASDVSDFQTAVSSNTDVTGKLAKSSNLSDLTNAGTARTNLGLVAGGAGDIWVEKAGDTMTGNLTITNTAPSISLTESDQVAPAGAYRIDASGDKLRVIRSASVLVEVDGTSFDNKSRKITSLANGTASTDAVNKSQLDGKADTSHTHTAANITDFNTATDARITTERTATATLTNKTLTAPVIDAPTGFLTGAAKITVGTSAPSSPSTGDLWVDTN